ncbi:hypothetical protein Tco_1403719 [Tanacetum coccineum]
MTTLKFADTHNLVAFLSKPAESEGFEQIVDFLNANPIRYALMINPTIYTSYIEQFWATVKAKTINKEVQLQALVDGKKVIITESTVRRDLQLEDAEGVDCLPNVTIFEQLALMGYEKISHKLTFYKAFFSPQWKFLIHTILQYLSSKTTAWNEVSSTMASAIICLATNQKFNFSKYIFESMVKNLENVSGKFLMYPRFVQVFLDKQLEGMSNHTRIFVTPSHTKKIFGNMKRVGKGFSGRETPLFPTMMVQAQEQMGKDNVADEAVNEEMDDSLERAATTPTSLDAEQDKGNINKTQSKATPNEPSSPGTSSGGGPRRQETIGDTIAQTRSENVSKLSNDPLLVRVLDLETTKTSQAQEITSLKKRVKRLEKKGGSRTHGLKRLYKVGSSRRVKSSDEEGLGKEDASKQGRIADIDVDAGITLDSTHFDADTDMFGVHDLDGDEVIVDNEDVVTTAKKTRSVVEEDTAGVTIPVSAATTTTTKTAITDVEMTLAQALVELKSAKPNADKVVIQEPEKGTTTTTLITTTAATTTTATTTTAASTRLRAKGIVIHEQEQAPTPTVSSQQPSQVKVQDKVGSKTASSRARRITDEEKARLFVQFLEQRRKHFAAKRAEEKRNKPPTRAQQRNIMCTYLKNMKGWKPKNLKNKSFANIQELFNKAMKMVNTFVDYRTELVEESSKKAEAEITHESSLKRAREELNKKALKSKSWKKTKSLKSLSNVWK